MCCGLYINLGNRLGHACEGELTHEYITEKDPMEKKKCNNTMVFCREIIRQELKFCKKCGVKFNMPRDMFVHWLCIHGAVDSTACGDCGKLFFSEGGLNFHQIGVHGGFKETNPNIKWV